MSRSINKIAACLFIRDQLEAAAIVEPNALRIDLPLWLLSNISDSEMERRFAAAWVDYPWEDLPKICDSARKRVRRDMRKDPAELMGRTECNRVVNFAGAPRLVGQMIDVTITQANSHTLRGEVVVREPA